MFESLFSYCSLVFFFLSSNLYLELEELMEDDSDSSLEAEEVRKR